MDYFQMAYMGLGGLGLFFLGLRFLTESLQSLAGDLIKKMISAVTSNRLIAVLVGLFVTTLVQSSSITTVMVVGLVNAGLMNLLQAIGVIFGANIGTTITGWILVIKVGKYGLLLIGLGIFPMLFAKNPKHSAIGKTLVALGLIFFGLQHMSGAFKPLRSDPDFISHLALFDANTILSLLGCVFIGCLLTFVIQSSSAMLGITIALASTGTLSYQTAAALVLGENIGTTITALLAAIGTNTIAKRAALSHALFNVLGVCIIILFFHSYVEFVDSIVPFNPDFLGPDGGKPHIAAHIAMGHTLFNVTATLVMLPFLQHLARFVERLIPEKKEKEVHHLTYLGAAGSMTPEIALNMATLELGNLAQMTKKILVLTKDYLSSPENNNEAYEKVFHLEGVSDNIQKEITTFVCQLMEGTLTAEQSAAAYSLIRAADELESIADYAQSLCRYRKRLLRNEQGFSAAAWAELKSYQGGIWNFYDKVSKLMETSDADIESSIISDAQKLNRQADGVRESHLKRLREGSCKALPGLTFSDMIVALRRIKNHTVNLFEATHYHID